MVNVYQDKGTFTCLYYFATSICLTNLYRILHYMSSILNSELQYLEHGNKVHFLKKLKFSKSSFQPGAKCGKLSQGIESYTCLESSKCDEFKSAVNNVVG